MDIATACRSGLPTLSGSAKQIAWGSEIREKKLAELAVLEMEYETGCANMEREMTAQETATDKVTRAALAAIATIDKAAWWIDHKNDSPRSMAREMIT